MTLEKKDGRNETYEILQSNNNNNWKKSIQSKHLSDTRNVLIGFSNWLFVRENWKHLLIFSCLVFAYWLVLDRQIFKAYSFVNFHRLLNSNNSHCNSHWNDTGAPCLAQSTCLWCCCCFWPFPRLLLKYDYSSHFFLSTKC